MYKKYVNKTLTLAVILLFISISVIPSTGTTNVKKSTMPTFYDGKTLYVGGDGPGNYSKIQDAIYDASNGDTVFVFDNSSPYYENVKVNKSIDLIGEDKSNTIIDANGIKDVVYVSVNDTRISGFTIQNSGDGTHYFYAGIVLHSSHNIVMDNIISNNNECGIYCDMDYVYGENGIYNNRIVNNKDYGIVIEDTGHYKNSVYGNYIVNNTCGILVTPRYFPSSVVYKNYICKNTIDGNDIGIQIANGYGILVFENIITNNKRGIYMWGHWWSCFNNSVYQNEIFNNEEGIRLESGFMGGAWNNNIYLNNITSNKKGVYIKSSFDEGFPKQNNISQNNFIKNNRNALSINRKTPFLQNGDPH